MSKHKKNPMMNEDIIYLDEIMGGKQSNTCWLADTETFVANHYVVNIDKDVEEPHNYRDITQLLMTMGENDTATFYINTWGGDLMTTIMLIDAIRNCAGQTYGIVTLGSSAGSFLALALDDCEVVLHGEMFIHEVQSGNYGSNSNQEKRIMFMKEKQKKFIEDVYSDFLTEDEMSRIQNNEELWLNDTECNTRLENRRKIRQERFQKEQEDARLEAEKVNKPKKVKIEKGV